MLNLELVNNIKTREDFLKFINALQKQNVEKSWENSTLPTYLEGIESWVEDMDGYFNNIGDQETLNKIQSNNLDWKLLAQILSAATMYE